MLHLVAGTLPAGGLVQSWPFRDPHHSASMAALVCEGARVRLNEISLAHGGVLFLDELSKFAKPALDALGQPLETGQVIVARANHHVTYLARFQLIAAINPAGAGILAMRSGHVGGRQNAGGAIARVFQDLCWTGSTWLSKFWR